ncbi:hypothetical protein ADL29_10655 [Streptomyces chattanoogensis]|uniref:Uncharacterized protein n=2 Tax=Streptomyces chattanoogensis TaxID=66876 RepID=A0A0N0XZ66_9ACTN|nr:DUF1877 family protein [Streptomyces chattanoogensis]KPC64648.1 hypothetical protein ADL29_10655 [Streptomyces chattanoogensis]
MGIYMELMRMEPETARAAVAGQAWPRPEMREGEKFRAVLSLDKAWSALQWLLTASGCPVDPVMGTPFLEEQPFDYAPPGLLTAEEVVRAADFLAGLDFDALADFADEEAMDADDVYPSGYDRQPHPGLAAGRRRRERVRFSGGRRGTIRASMGPGFRRG